jgi:hypothetical protein
MNEKPMVFNCLVFPIYFIFCGKIITIYLKAINKYVTRKWFLATMLEW